MTQKFTLHSHCILDAEGSIKDMVMGAKELGFEAIGISEHFEIHPKLENSVYHKDLSARGLGDIISGSFEERISLFKEHFDNIDKVKSDIDGIEVLKGFEVDYFDEPDWLAEFNKSMNYLKPDYLIGSCHFVEYDGEYVGMHHIFKNVKDEEIRYNVLNSYLKQVEKVAASGYFDFLAHIDIPVKYGFLQGEYWDVAKLRLIDVIAESKIAVEVNSKMISGHGEPSPGIDMLVEMNKRNIPVFLSDDSHKVSGLAKHYDKAWEMLEDIGYQNIIDWKTLLTHSK